ncbi:MAG TPA: DUF4235 domain-containing protein [Gemmatimonadaceae bacterium]|jgi:hypothetical protein|nr:DUF4235 domain-containing protein [Gemmatimonadaceae bacterium]
MRIKTETLNSRKTTWLLVGAGAAMVAGRLVERGLDKGWRAVRHEDPPDAGRRVQSSWPAALAWTAISGAAVAAVQLAARRGAHVGLRRLTGKRMPPNL